MLFATTKFEVSDPALYDPLISNQKKEVRRDAKNAAKWLELGRLQEEKVEMTKCFAEKNLLLRWIVVMTYVLFFMTTAKLYFDPPPFALPWTFTLPSFVIGITFLIWVTFIRYPRSGNRYFRKVLFLDPDCADAYMYLGRIALRRYQKKRAGFLLEQALKKGGGKKIERELKNLYEKEFISFFNQQFEKEATLNEFLRSKDNEILRLEAELAAFKNKVEKLTNKTKQVKWKTGQAVKQADMDTTTRIHEIRQDYEKQIKGLEQAMEAEEEQKEAARKEYSNLTMEIMESKAADEKQSFEQSTKAVENIMSPPVWQKLSDQTRSCLATAEHAFSMLDKNSEDTDFSLVGMELCKALEIEINKVLVRPFAKNLNGCEEEFLGVNKIGDLKGKPKYFTFLAKVVDNASYPEMTSLTLGQYLFVLKKTLEGEYALDEYGNFLDKISETSGIGAWRTILQKLKTVTNEYRNSIVHHSRINIDQCDHLRELIFTGENSLLAECCKI